MAFNQPTVGKSLLISLFLWVMTIAFLQINSVFFKSSEVKTIIGGFVGSLLFLFQILFIGNVKRDVKYPEIILSLLTTAAISSSVHRVSGTTSVLFSIGWIFFLNTMSDRIHSKQESTISVASSKRSTKNK
ncbi:hypothetical protein CYY_009145 [Polysphondylium violaceum]|uniref:Dolichyl-diphosphooligosaccharide--protein glycosyltransferase subunit KCP2 n=1 Tax=Polysphondylium violaceum TaxID=133409 RepID=A0A8J4PKN7_9MYCE|nr:hypothetical protein CYY_009145 [Polysphondylium violaceum]